jgi:hypothetical protein
VEAEADESAPGGVERLAAARQRVEDAQHEYDLTRGGLDDLQTQIRESSTEDQRAALQQRYDSALRERKRLLARHRKATDARWGSNSWAVPEVLECVEELRERQGHDSREHALLKSGVLLPSVSLGGGANGTYEYELSDGSHAWHKPFGELYESTAKWYGQLAALQPVHEVVAWQLAKCLGPPYEELVPPCVLRDVDGELGSLALNAPGKSPVGRVDFRVSPQWRDAAFFDALIGQQDRHRRNFFMDGDQIHLIDHGFSFALPGDPCNQSVFVEAAAGETLTGAERDVLARLIGSGDLLGLRSCLSPDRAAALESRARSMLSDGWIPGAGEY